MASKELNLLQGANKEYTQISVSGEGDNFRVSIPDRRLYRYYHMLKDGGIVVDKGPCEDKDDWVKWVFNSPLPGKETRLFNQSMRESAAMMLPGLSGGFDTLALMAQNPEYTGLDTVEYSVYADWWQTKGARIGKRVGDEIIWDDGSKEEIKVYP